LDILKEVRGSESGSEKGAVVNWPAFSEEPISEYSNNCVFCMIFTWLYPGVNGDFNEDRKIDISVKDWESQQLHLADGSFYKDKNWCFFALNYAERSSNMTQGCWFVKNLINSEDVPEIETLNEKLRNNDTKFIEKFQYFYRLVPGSDSYWINKPADLVSWIGHHVEAGNGPPSLLLTLSCAEYHWKDIERFLNKRRSIAGEPPLTLDSITEKVKAVNDYSIFIQQYFQARVTNFLENYANQVFGIEHYFARFEFAKSRGQIHVHLL
jgi:hypothetical protein